MNFYEVFLQYYDEVKKSLLYNINEYKLSQHVMEYLEYMIDYNVRSGKLTRGIATLSTVYELSGNNLTEIQIKEACILGWAIEWLQACFLLLDDIMDRSEMRRNKVCWYKRKEV